jgi:hypothetical protein
VYGVTASLFYQHFICLTFPLNVLRMFAYAVVYEDICMFMYLCVRPYFGGN